VPSFAQTSFQLLQQRIHFWFTAADAEWKSMIVFFFTGLFKFVPVVGSSDFPAAGLGFGVLRRIIRAVGTAGEGCSCIWTIAQN